MKTKVLASTAVVALLCVPFWGQASAPQANAQNAELEQHIRELEDRVIALEGKIRTMESEKAAAPSRNPLNRLHNPKRVQRRKQPSRPQPQQSLRQLLRMRLKPGWPTPEANCRFMGAILLPPKR